MSGSKLRVGVCGHDLKFWSPLQRILEETGKYEFREDLWIGHDGHDPEESKAMLEWADVIVAEWALGNAVYYSRHKRRNQRLLVRLHLQERNTPFLEEIEYGNVDKVIFVGDHIMRECMAKASIPKAKCDVVGNFVDVTAYDLSKHDEMRYTLGVIGTAPSRKRLDLAVDTLELLRKRDSRYTLRVKGASPASLSWLWRRPEEVEYYEGLYARINSGDLRHKVIFDPQGPDVHQWLRMVGAVLSPSDFESFHMAVAEGAASGALPVLWNWEGSEEIYPEFERVSSADEAADLIEFFNRSAAGDRYRRQVRDVIRERYAAERVSAQWQQLLDARSGTRASAGRRSNRPVIVVWAIDNWKTFHRREMLQALAAAADYDFLVVEPGNHFQSIESMGWASAEELTRIARGELIPEAANVFRIRLLTGSIPVIISDRIGGETELSVLDGIIRHNYDSSVEVLHWIYKPDQAARLGRERPFVYEVYDDYTINFGTGETISAIAKAERDILPQARHVFFTSLPLMERKARGLSNHSLVGNGVMFDVFRRYRLEQGERQSSGRKVAGYLGNLSDFFDWKTMTAVCETMPHIDFVFHGQIEVEKLGENGGFYEALRRMDNVRFSGRVSRELGAAAVNRYDVLLIPFVLNDAMHAVNPLKLWEYLATGLPIVMSPLEAVTLPSPQVRYASRSEEWRAAIAQAIVEVDQGLATERIELANQFSWRNVVAEYARVLDGLFGLLPRP